MEGAIIDTEEVEPKTVVEQLPIDTIIEPLPAEGKEIPLPQYYLRFDRSISKDDLVNDVCDLLQMVNIVPVCPIDILPENITRHFKIVKQPQEDTEKAPE